MGKASKWFRGLLGLKRPDSPSSAAATKPPKDRRRWSFVKSYREKDHSATDHHAPPTNGGHSSGHVESADPHIAAVTAAMAEAAFAAVARLTSSGRCPATVAGEVTREKWAAVKIQAAFRGSLLLTRIEVRPASPSLCVSFPSVLPFSLLNAILLYTLHAHALPRARHKV
ncbi:unnamed protein product [Sphenostylis stenocarpa]|uniref:Uncharacterized protein n=1 Tax=Sphenostylis stenocarpa TaxID=92480 RepID=A0AA86VCK9_9FABA|nr:unnamed protein product [Sphenostylis stenocarpa]